ncbi:MAG: tetratricopeptide repeat protein, partial [Alphaproteobacteria bacterium]|nr:tetratricopeptide repeat protein [Alphaproteobacteria bacterium]
YVQLGKPELRDLPLAARPAPEQQLTERDSLLANIEQLEQHLETTTDNAAVWAALGRARLRAGLYQDAVEALAKSVDLSHDDPSLRSELGEAMVHAAGLQVTPAATEHFRAALEATPNEPRARFYLGMALAQEGEVDAAIDGWSQLLAVSPSDAPWRAQIIEAIRGALQSEGRPADDVIATLPEGTAPASSSDDNPTSTAAQDDQIRGMVEGLAARLENEPDNIEGWLMLGRSRLVLKEPDLAKKAFERARELAPNNPDVLLGYAASLLEPGETPGGDPVVVEEAVAIYEKLLTIAPDDPEPRWLLGLAAAQAGDKDRAIAHWRDLLGLIEDGAEDKAVVEARINALEDGEPAASIAAGTPSIAPMAASAAASTNGSAAGGDRVPNNARPGTGPGPEDVAAMAEMTPEERQTQIRGMVDGLAARLEDDPSDIEGWLRLAQSRTVLGEPDAAAEAYRRAMAQAPDDPDVLRAYAGSLLGAPHPETEAATVGADAADLYRKIIAIEPDDPEAHWYLGLAAIQDGTIDDAKTHWRRVLDLLGPDHPNYAAVQSRLDRVETEIR